MNPAHALFALLVFPGLLYGVPMGWLMLGVERRTRARLQGRLGPPLSQPFFDFVKLAAKWPVARSSGDVLLLTGLPILALGSMAGALALLPVFAGETGFAGDLILFVGLVELPPLCLILAGYASRSIYGEVGATREAIVGIASTVPLLAALVAMAAAAGSVRLTTIAAATPWAVRLPALLAFLFCLPVKLRLNPFSLANAEQEIMSGPLTEFDGRRLALWELAHGLEWVALSGALVTLAVPMRSPSPWVDAIVFAALSLVVVLLLTALESATARLKLAQATHLLWRWASLPAVLALALAFFVRRLGF